MAVVIPDTSPAQFLARFRGLVTSSRPGYPSVLHLHVKDAEGGLWRFGTFESRYLPTDPEMFVGKTVVDVDLNASSAEMTIYFSDGADLRIVPFSLESDEVDADLESWWLITPEGLILNYGPGDHWVLKRASDPI